MTFVRGMFLAAFMVITVGSIGVHKAVAPLFSRLGSKTAAATPQPTSTPQPVVSQVNRRISRATPTPTVPPTVLPTATLTAAATKTPAVVITFFTPTAGAARKRAHPRVVRQQHTHRRHATATPTPKPTPTAATGVVALQRYWIGSLAAVRGATISVGYVIQNGTGHTQRLMLGASIKGTRVLNWLTGSVADPPHDIVAVVPPGITTHVRYFTLPAGLRPGAYDVAWGLRDAATNQRDALVFSGAILRVSR